MSISEIANYSADYAKGAVVGGGAGAGAGLLLDSILTAIGPLMANWPAVFCTLFGAAGGVLVQLLKNRNDSRRAESAELRLGLANKRIKELGGDPVSD